MDKETLAELVHQAHIDGWIRMTAANMVIQQLTKRPPPLRPPYVEKTCLWCGADFVVSHSSHDQNLCNLKCSGSYTGYKSWRANAERDISIVLDIRSGATKASLGRKWGMSRTNVDTICRKFDRRQREQRYPYDMKETDPELWETLQKMRG